MQNIKVAIIEDNNRYAQHLKRYLCVTERIGEIDIFSSMGDFKKNGNVSKYDIVLLDINLPDGNGLDLIQFIKNKSPDTEIIILTTYTDENKLFSALRLGASGYITKENTTRYILEGINEILAGGAIIPPDMAGRF
ncbi:MAG: response regulator transcription factor [Deltaproteobacteria bacterium]|nr:response regulator transcription factor [Deltaproteobacteria bacterium]